MPAYQPEAEVQDLSGTESDMSNISSSGGNALNDSAHHELQQPSAAQQMPTTLLLQNREEARRDTFVASQISAIGQEAFHGVTQCLESDYGGSADDSDEPVNINSPATPAPRRRNLPKTVKRTKKYAAKTADLQSYEGYFGSTDSEDEGQNHSQDTVELSPRHRFLRGSLPMSTATLKRSRHGQDISVPDSKLNAASYLENVLGKLDKESKELLSGSSAQLRLIDIASTDIRLRPRNGR
ncbi:hypothetical protein BGZ67_000893 [Mortierella alpina]|nr:hypothetical protein BGZ67_000893 [Mortierella alpina]